MWERMRETTDNEWIRETATKEIEKLQKKLRAG
jgi:hypothetical protein